MLSPWHLSLLVVCAVLLSDLQVGADENVPAAGEALQKLKDGNDRFAANRPAAGSLSAAGRQELSKGQRPFAVVLACADSRVAPEIVFDQGLGQLFVVRVAGNVAEPGIVGSIEYAVAHLHVPLVVVLGHENCGAVEAALGGHAFPGDLGWLIRQVHTGANGKNGGLEAAIRDNATYQAAELLRRSVVLKDLAASRRVQIVPGVYSLTTGKVAWLKLTAGTP